MAVIFAISHATLVVGVAAPEHLAAIIGLALLGTATLNLFSGLFGQMRGGIHMSQDVPSAAMGAALLALVAERAVTGGSLTLPEIVVLIVTASLLLAICLFLFGQFGLSTVMRYAPRPVVAGFLAGTGYFILLGGLGICLAAEVTLTSLPDFLTAPASYKLAVALFVALAFELGQRLLPPSIMIGLVMFGAIAAFHIASVLLGAPTDGWFVVLPEGGTGWPPVPFSDLLQVNPGFIFSQVVPLLSMVVLSTLALLMMTSAVQAVTRDALDMDKELKATGIGNFASALLGGMPGYVGAASTLSAYKVAPPHRAISFVAAALALSVFVLGNVILSFLPMPVFAGFLIWVGIAFLRDWLWREVKNTPMAEAAVTIAIFLVIVVFGLFEGTIFGLLAAGALFVVNYSRMSPVRSMLFGNAYLGASELNPQQAETLQAKGGSIAILKLQGYVFFGTAHQLGEQIQTLIRTKGVRYLVLDFKSVTGIDATAMATFWSLAADLEEAGAEATFTSVSSEVKSVFDRAGFVLGASTQINIAATLDAGLEAYQARLLEKAGGSDDTTQDITSLLEQVMGSKDMGVRLSGYMDRLTLNAGDALITEGDTDRDIFLLESGRLEVSVGTGHARHRIRVLGAGAVIGEISFYTGGQRTSSVTALDDAIAWRFSEEAARKLLSDDPELASRFHAGVAALLAQRVVANTRLVQMLQS